MKIGEFNIMIASDVDKDRLSAEIYKDNFALGEVYLDEEGKPIIHIGPNRLNEHGVWTIDYRVFKQIIAALDEFFVSVGYSPEDE